MQKNKPPNACVRTHTMPPEPFLVLRWCCTWLLIWHLLAGQISIWELYAVTPLHVAAAVMLCLKVLFIVMPLYRMFPICACDDKTQLRCPHRRYMYFRWWLVVTLCDAAVYALTAYGGNDDTPKPIVVYYSAATLVFQVASCVPYNWEPEYCSPYLYPLPFEDDAHYNDGVAEMFRRRGDAGNGVNAV